MVKCEEVSETYSVEVMEEKFLDEEGLSNYLRTKYNSEMKGLDQRESFLTQLERELLSIGWDTDMP